MPSLSVMTATGLPVDIGIFLECIITTVLKYEISSCLLVNSANFSLGLSRCCKFGSHVGSSMQIYQYNIISTKYLRLKNIFKINTFISSYILWEKAIYRQATDLVSCETKCPFFRAIDSNFLTQKAMTECHYMEFNCIQCLLKGP